MKTVNMNIKERVHTAEVCTLSFMKQFIIVSLPPFFSKKGEKSLTE